MKRNLTTLILSFLVAGAFAQNEMMHLPNGTTGISSTTNSRGVAIGPDFDTPEGRLHIRDKGLSGTDLMIDMENQLIADTGGTSYLSPDYFIQARFKDNEVGPFSYIGQFSVDRAGKIQSGFVNPAVTDQLAVRNDFGIYASINRTLRFDLTNSAARMIWESPNDNFQFINSDYMTTALQLGEQGQVGINTGSFFGDHDLFVDGSVYIYEDDTDSCPYSLLIEGTAIAEEMFIRLKSDSTWCDYVFEADYDLRTLYEVEEYIEENGHLPNIPSAAEIEETGIPVGEMERLLTEKVEELTLYVIELRKEIDTLKQELEKE